MTYDPLAPAFGAPFPCPVSVSAAVAPSFSSSPAAAAAAHSFPFSAPSAFHLVGSYPLRTCLVEAGAGRASLNIDLCLELPASCLKSKDYWDYRYLAKRARYLQHVAGHVHAQGGWAVRVGKMRGSVEKPVLLLYPLKQHDSGSGAGWRPYTGVLGRVVVRVFAAPPQGFFSIKRLHPSKCNVHAAVLAAGLGIGEEQQDAAKRERATAVKQEAKEPVTDEDGGAGAGPPTPYYNSLLAEDLSYVSHLSSLHSVLSPPSAAPLRQALGMLRLWAAQRRLEHARGDAGNGGWGEFELVAQGGTAAAAAAAAPAGASGKKQKKQQQQPQGSSNGSSSSSSSSVLVLSSPSLYTYTRPGGACSGFNGFFFSMLLLHLWQTRAIYRSMTALQVFRAALLFLLWTDLLAQGLSAIVGAQQQQQAQGDKVRAAAAPGGLVLGTAPATGSSSGPTPGMDLTALARLTNPLLLAADGTSGLTATPAQSLLSSWQAARGHALLFLVPDASVPGAGVNLLARAGRQDYLRLVLEAYAALTLLDDAAAVVTGVFGSGEGADSDNRATALQGAGQAAGTTAAAAADAGAHARALRVFLEPCRPLALPGSLSSSSVTGAGVGAGASARDTFTALLLTPQPFHRRFDAFVRLRLGAPREWRAHSARLARANTPKAQGSSGSGNGGAQAQAFLAHLHEGASLGGCGDADALTTLVRQVEALLAAGLTDRLVLLQTRTRLTAAASSSSNSSSGGGDPELHVEVGLQLNPFHASRVLDLGPAADDLVAAGRFRALWGTRSTLRRFKDGSIVEAVVWTTPVGSTGAAASATAAAAAGGGALHAAPHLIPFQICADVLSRHLGLGPERVDCVVAQFDALLRVRELLEPPTRDSVERDAWAMERGDAAASPALPLPPPLRLRLSGPLADPHFLHSGSLSSSFASLSVAVRGLTTAASSPLPLSISSLRMTGELSRHTAVCPPLPHGGAALSALAPGAPLHALTQAVPVLLQFESSSSWPDDSLAISRIKSAFYVAIARGLGERGVGAGSPSHPGATVALVELDSVLLVHRGYLFRLRIFSPDTELGVRGAEEQLGQIRMGGPLLPVPSSFDLRRECVYLPLLGAQLAHACTRFPLFASACRLAKRWLSAHMFSPFFPCPEAVELSVLPLFTEAACRAYSAPPASALQALVRWLVWLSSADHASTPLVVDVAGDLTAEEGEKAQAAFALQQARGDNPLFFIATKLDLSCELLYPRPALPGPPPLGVHASQEERDRALLAHRTPRAWVDEAVLARVVAYARSSLRLLESLLVLPSDAAGLGPALPPLVAAAAAGAPASAPATTASAAWKSVFRTPLSVPQSFDLLLHLRPEALPLQHLVQALAPPRHLLLPSAAEDGSKAKSKKGASGFTLPPDAGLPSPAAAAAAAAAHPTTPSRGLPLLGFHPTAALLAGLRHLFGHAAYFFFDAHGGTTVGVRWKDEFRARLAPPSSSSSSSAPSSSSSSSRRRAQGSDDDEEGEKEEDSRPASGPPLAKFSVKAALDSRPVFASSSSAAAPPKKHSKKGSLSSSSSLPSIVGVQVHLDQMLDDMRRVGEGIIERIQTTAE